MAKRAGVTFEDFSKMALALLGVEARSSYGTPGFYVKNKFMARLREPDVMVLTPVHDDEQRFLMETQPEAFSSPTTIAAIRRSWSGCRKSIADSCRSWSTRRGSAWRRRSCWRTRN